MLVDFHSAAFTIQIEDLRIPPAPSWDFAPAGRVSLGALLVVASIPLFDFVLGVVVVIVLFVYLFIFKTRGLVLRDFPFPMRIRIFRYMRWGMKEFLDNLQS